MHAIVTCGHIRWAPMIEGPRTAECTCPAVRIARGAAVLKLADGTDAAREQTSMPTRRLER